MTRKILTANTKYITDMIRKFFITAIALTAAIGASAGSGLTKGDINLIVASDLGRNGYYEQKKVAGTMGEIADSVGPEAVLALGDTHHYEGVQSISDPLWMTNYELIYSHPELMVDWYPICGNHEYRGNTQAVIDYSDVSRRWTMPARYYTKTFEDKGTTLKVVFIDTTPLIDKYRKNSDEYPDAVTQDMDAQLKWLDSTLSDAREDWVVVVGHHPIFAFTDKSASERTDMQKRVDSILRKHNVDMYICGHLHNYQHLRRRDSTIDYIVNTSGSRTRVPEKTEGTVFCSEAPGFSVLTVDKKSLNLNMLDSDGNVIHTVTRTK